MENASSVLCLNFNIIGFKRCSYQLCRFCFMAFQFTGQTTFLALGKSRFSLFFSLLRKVFIVVPLTIFLPHIAHLGVTGVFLAEPISNVVGGLASFITMIFVCYRPLRRAANKEALSHESL